MCQTSDSLQGRCRKLEHQLTQLQQFSAAQTKTVRELEAKIAAAKDCEEAVPDLHTVLEALCSDASEVRYLLLGQMTAAQHFAKFC